MTSQLPCGGIGVDSDTYFNDTFTPAALRAAVGCAVELCLAIVEGRVSNGFAIIRPPGHHAEPNQVQSHSWKVSNFLPLN